MWWVLREGPCGERIRPPSLVCVLWQLARRAFVAPENHSAGQPRRALAEASLDCQIALSPSFHPCVSGTPRTRPRMDFVVWERSAPWGVTSNSYQSLLFASEFSLLKKSYYFCCFISVKVRTVTAFGENNFILIS